MHTEKRPGVPGLRNERDHLEGYLADGSPGATTTADGPKQVYRTSRRVASKSLGQI